MHRCLFFCSIRPDSYAELISAAWMEDGFLLYPYGDDVSFWKLLFKIEEGQARSVLEAALPLTPLFNMTFSL